MGTKKVSKKKKTRRSNSKYPGLDPRVNRINLRDMMDFDYVNKLNDEEKEWLSKFSTEFYTADFRHEKPIIKGKKARRKVYKTNNDRNQDLTAYLGNYGKLSPYEALEENDLKSQSPEDALIRMIDLKKSSSK